MLCTFLHVPSLQGMSWLFQVRVENIPGVEVSRQLWQDKGALRWDHLWSDVPCACGLAGMTNRHQHRAESDMGVS